MAYVLVQILPNCVPITSGSTINYCNLDFTVYKAMELTEEQKNFPKLEQSQNIKEGPKIVIKAKTAPAGSIDSKEALCCSNDIPSAGYSFLAPHGWSCSTKYDQDAEELTFVFSAPVGGGDDFQAASIQMKDFFTTAQAGDCLLEVRVENFDLFVPDVTDCTFNVPIKKQYETEIIDFTANEMRTNFFLHHSLPVRFQWYVSGDLATRLELLQDGNVYCGLSDFSGEKVLKSRNSGDHNYTLKMSLRTGEKTRSITIQDTRWIKTGYAEGIQADFSRMNSVHFCGNMAYVLIGQDIYRSQIENGVPKIWEMWRSYKGDVVYSDTAQLAICGEQMYLIGGKKENSNELFYSVCDYGKETEEWKDCDLGQTVDMEGGIAEYQNSEDLWMVYLKQAEDTVILTEFDPKIKMFMATGIFSVEKSLRFIAAGIRDKNLYLAFATSGPVIIKKFNRGNYNKCCEWRIPESPEWMQWENGSIGMCLMTDLGIYEETTWNKIDRFQPSCAKESRPWCGCNDGKIISFFAEDSKENPAAIWTAEI